MGYHPSPCRAPQYRWDLEVLSPVHSSWAASINPPCFIKDVLEHPFSPKFQVRCVDKYMGDSKSDNWLADYLTVVNQARGDELNALRYVPSQFYLRVPGFLGFHDKF